MGRGLGVLLVAVLLFAGCGKGVPAVSRSTVPPSTSTSSSAPVTAVPKDDLAARAAYCAERTRLGEVYAAMSAKTVSDSVGIARLEAIGGDMHRTATTANQPLSGEIEAVAKAVDRWAVAMKNDTNDVIPAMNGLNGPTEKIDCPK